LALERKHGDAEQLLVRQSSSGLIQGMLKNALQHHQAGRLAEAEHTYRQILSIDASHSDSIHLMGMIAFQRGQNEAAAETIGKSIAINKKEALYHSNLGTVLQSLGRLNEAVQSYQRAVALKPDYAEAHSNLGVTLSAQGKDAEAMAQYERVLALNPNHAYAHTNLGALLFEQGKIEDAIAHYLRALALKPDCAETFSNLGNALNVQGRLDEAVSCYRRALTLKPDYATAYGNLGNVLQAQNKFDEALACYDRVLALRPGSADAYHSKALLQLLLGEFPAGWVHYEWRWEIVGHAPVRTYSQPRWAGETLVAGSLLLWGEQGVGDEIMFAGLIPEVIRTGNRCILDCDSRLKPIFSRSFPGIEVVSGTDAVKNWDRDISAHLPTGSLPGLFRTTSDAFGATTSPYLVADPLQKEQFRTRYSDGKKLVGLAWHTRNKKTGYSRSVSLSQFAPLFARTGIAWVSLQYGDHDELERQAEAAHAPLLIDRAVDQFSDMDAFAAQIAALDLVITIDNSTAHLAGALGVPVWVLLPFARDWRWMLDRDDSPWYPTMRLFRQPKPGDWASVVEDVQGCLRAATSLDRSWLPDQKGPITEAVQFER
jgi:tetratricopeptide (TPR) repeat protein